MRSKFKIHIKADTDEATREELREVAEIIVAMREAQKKYRSEFGFLNKQKAQQMEELADKWISKHKVYYDYANEPKIAKDER